METQHRQHPPAFHLAALALGKLKPDAATTVQSHLDECDECRRFVANTPPDELAAIIKHARVKPAAEQNTRATSLSGTVDASPVTRTAPQADAEARVVPSNSPTPNPSSVAHSVGEGEIPHDLFVQSKYRIVRVLGRGGMGTVYEAEHVRMNRPVAIKVINPELVDHPQALLRFETEIKAVASLDHANIARAFDAENIGSLQVFVMEFVRGQTLYDFFKSRRRLSVVDACRCIRQAFVGLQHAHQQGLVHRDLKPQNLMLTRDTGHIKILDFGLAKAVSENRQSGGLTHSRATMGTYAYMAPEQALDAANADIRADIYSLGCTLYLLIAGTLPFNYDVDTKLLLAHQNEIPISLHEIFPEVPRELSDLVARMLAKNPEDRPQTPRDAADALLPFARGGSAAALAEPAASSSPALSRRGMNSWMWGVIAAAILTLSGFGGWTAGLFSARTAEGTIVVEGLPDDADVTVDGQTVTVSRKSDAATITAVKTGTHHLKVVEGGQELWANDVKVNVAGELVRVKYEGFATENAGGRQDPPKSASVEKPPVAKQSEANSIPPGNAAFPDASVFSGKWSIEGDELVQSAVRGSDQKIFFGDPGWADYDFTFKAKSVAGSHGFKALFDASKIGCCMFACGNYGNSTTDLGWGFASGWKRGPRAALKVEFGRWYTVRIEARGSMFKCYVDDELLITASKPEFTHGRVGFATWDSESHFKDIEVRSPDGAVLWRGLPRLPGSPSPSAAAPTGQTENAQPKPEGTTDDSSASATSKAPEATNNADISAYLQPGSVWKGQRKVIEGGRNSGVDRPCELTITARDGNTFTGTVFVQEPRSGRPRIEGKIDGNTLTWSEEVRNRTITIRATLGPTGKTMHYTFHREYTGGATHEGEGELALETPPGSEATSGNDADRLKKDEAANDAQEESAPDSAEVPSTKDEKGFVRLFNGKDLMGWFDAVDSFEVVDGAMRCKPGHSGNLLSKDTFRNFVLRYEYKLPPGGNSGLALRMIPKGGDAAENGLEVQILDDTDSKYADTIREWQYDGSLYGLVSAKRGFRRPVGEWNEEEVTLVGDRISIVLNGTEILNADIAEARKTPLNGKPHPGASRTGGHLGFIAQDSPVEFRNIRIKRLPLTSASPRPIVQRTPARKTKSDKFVSLFNRKDLTGWETHHSYPLGWTVLNGAIIGRGRSYLYTTNDDFENFHVRIVARIASGAGGGLFVRCNFGVGSNDAPGGGFEAQIGPNNTGMLFTGGGKIDVARELVPPVGQWFTQEVIADGNHIIELVNGRKTAEFFDTQPRNTRGRIALQAQDNTAVVEFASIEVKELQSTNK